MMKRNISMLLLLFLFGQTVGGQQRYGGGQKAWSLQECIDYAVKNSIGVQQNILNVEQQKINLNTSRNSRLPGISASLNQSNSFVKKKSEEVVLPSGEVVEAASGGASSGLSAGASASVTLFSGFAAKHTIEADRLNLSAALKDLERAQDDVALNVTSLYLTVLFQKEILRLARNQVELSGMQVERSRLLVEKGKSAESQLYESRALLAKDQLSLTEAENSLTMALLDLSQALNIETELMRGFDIKTPVFDNISIEAISEISSDIYSQAVVSRPGILAERLRLESSERNVLLAKSTRYPQISLSAGYGNNYYYSYIAENNLRLADQFRNNWSQSIGLTVSIPIFNGFATRNKIRSANLGVRSQQLTLIKAERDLYQEIEQAYQRAQADYKKYLSANVSVEAARIAFRAQEKRAEAGLATIFDFNDAKTRLLQSESEGVQAKYGFIFSRKILDFYMGKPLDFRNY